MKYGIYYAYWERQWGGDYVRYAKKAAALGFDLLEISCASLPELAPLAVRELAQAAKDAGIGLTAGYGPRPKENLASPDPAVVRRGFEFWKRTFEVLQTLGITLVGGGLYSYWPVDYSQPFDREEDFRRSVESLQKLAPLAAAAGITLGMEALNRFEGYLINTAAEGLAYVRAVGEPNVRLMLDTFHMNIEEDSLAEAIREAGPLLGHFHVGEPNRRPPRRESRLDWPAIGKALRETAYEGAVVMEPFVLSGGAVGRDIRVWRDLFRGASEEALDQEAQNSLRFLQQTFEAPGAPEGPSLGLYPPRLTGRYP
jgi:D-psicose/D-tagatose/L-ribulose 3-epimerase